MPIPAGHAVSPAFALPLAGTPSLKGASSLAGRAPDGHDVAPAAPGSDVAPAAPGSDVAPAMPGGSDVASAAPDGGLPGLVVSWTGGLALDQVLSAAARYGRHRAGEDLPAGGESDRAGEGAGARMGEPAAGPQADELGEEAMMAAIEDRGRVLPVAALGGHAIMAPGPDLAGWLACDRAAERDDAALVTSITAWRKVTSWAQAQELQAVAELARRRRCAGTVDAGGDDRDPVGEAGLPGGDQVAGGGLPGSGQAAGACTQGSDAVAELEAEFAPNEVALALTLTQGSAEYWMDLAVSLTRRLPAALAALGDGTIDLSRAKLIDHYTSSLDVELAKAVERQVLVRAGHQTTGQLRASLQRAVLAADPAAAERRRQEAEKGAWVALFGDHAGTASLSGRFLPGAQAAAAWARISAMAKAMESAGAAGGMDLLRAQVFVGLLIGTLPLIPAAEGAPDDAGPDEDGGDGLDGGGPDDGGPDDAGPGDGGPGGAGPGDGGPGGAGPGDGGSDGAWDDGGCRDSGRSSFAANGRQGDADQPGDDALTDHAHPDTERNSFTRRPAGITGSRSVPIWPPLPLPGAAPAPGCARLTHGGPADSHDRRGPPGTSPASCTSAFTSGAPPEGAGSPRLAGRLVLCVPWRTLAGWSSEPGELSRVGPVTAAVTRDLALAAAVDVTCEWKVIVVGPLGQAVAVAKVRRAPVGAGGGGSGSAPVTGRGGHVRAAPGVVGRITLTIPAGLLWSAATPTAEELAVCGVLAKILGAALRAAAKAASARGSRSACGDCTHSEASAGYRVPDSMRALVEARDQTCGFSTCRQPAWRSEKDHTIAYRLGGANCPW